MYALIQRRVELYDEFLVIVQGRGGDRYRYSDIKLITIVANNRHPSLIIRLNSGKKSEVFLSADLPLVTITRFLSQHGVECVEGSDDLKRL